MSKPATAATKTSSSSTSPVLTTAPPPWHAKLLVYSMIIAFGYYTPTALQTMRDIAGPQTFVTSRFLTLDQLIIARWAIGCLLVAVNAHDYVWGHYTFYQTYYQGSQLKPSVFQFRGLFAEGGSWRTLPFNNTSFSKISIGLLGISFLINGTIAHIVTTNHNNNDDHGLPPFVYQAAIILWNMTAPAALLVSAVVKYVLWPHTLQTTGTSQAYGRPSALIIHNANSIAALTEVGLLGGLPCRWEEFPLAPLLGLMYLLFAWFMATRWSIAELVDDNKDNDKSKNKRNTKTPAGPQFLYPFLDTTLPGYQTSLAILALFGTLCVSYALFATADYVLTHDVLLGGNVMAHAVAVALMASTVCKFRD